MHLLLDGLSFENTRQRGIQRYHYEILARLPAPWTATVFLSAPPAVPLPARPGLDVIVRPEHVHASRSREPLTYLSRAIRRTLAPTPLPAADVFHSTFFTPPPDPTTPSVVTVHDMIPEDHPELDAVFGPGHRADKRRAMDAARLLIAVSAATAADVVRHYPHLAPRLRVIHHGGDHLPDLASTLADPVPGVPARFALFVGDRGLYKNFALVAAAAPAARWPAGLPVVAVGPPLEASESADLADLLADRKLLPLGRVPDDTLSRLYRTAACFVFPSLAEGFGFPLIEAQRLGTPVICSDTPVFREVAGEGARFFDPRDPAALADAVREVTAAVQSDPAHLATIRGRGLANAARFSWDRAAAQTAAVYAEAAGDLAR